MKGTSQKGGKGKFKLEKEQGQKKKRRPSAQLRKKNRRTGGFAVGGSKPEERQNAWGPVGDQR